MAALVTADVFQSLSNFFDSPLWGVLKILIVVFIILMWLALAIWVYRDARRRNTAPGYPPLMALVGLLIPFLGPEHVLSPYLVLAAGLNFADLQLIDTPSFKLDDKRVQGLGQLGGGLELRGALLSQRQHLGLVLQ